MPDPIPSNDDSLKLQLLTARKKEWWLATADCLPPVNCDTHYVSRHRTHNLSFVSPTCRRATETTVFVFSCTVCAMSRVTWAEWDWELPRWLTSFLLWQGWLGYHQTCENITYEIMYRLNCVKWTYSTSTPTSLHIYQICLFPKVTTLFHTDCWSQQMLHCMILLNHNTADPSENNIRVTDFCWTCNSHLYSEWQHTLRRHFNGVYAILEISALITL